MKRLKVLLYAVEIPSVFIPFIAITLCFPSGGILTQNGRLTEFWVIPAVFWMAATFLDKVSEAKTDIPQWVFFLFSKLAAGVALGLSFGAILILNEWYADPNTGTWEPLFTATGLSGAGVLAAERWFDRIRKKE